MAKGKKDKSAAAMSIEELEKSASQLEAEIFALRNEFALQRKLEKPHLLKQKRHERARVLTFLTQNRRNAQ